MTEEYIKWGKKVHTFDPDELSESDREIFRSIPRRNHPGGTYRTLSTDAHLACNWGTVREYLRKYKQEHEFDED
jgi:hypothetical protein